ncbi:hypothetical protein JCM8547_005336 [Rhodosporidiobolus lusitaniae]
MSDVLSVLQEYTNTLPRRPPLLATAWDWKLRLRAGGHKVGGQPPIVLFVAKPRGSSAKRRRGSDAERIFPIQRLPTPPPSPAPRPPASLHSLPTELVALVLSHLPLSSLPAVSLVSRAFLPLSRSSLYRDLVLRTQRNGRAAPSGSSALDERSTALLKTLEGNEGLRKAVKKVDFDLLSHLSADETASILGQIFALLSEEGVRELKLGAGAYGHGMGFKPLRHALSSLPPSSAAGKSLRILDVEDCTGAPHTLAAVLVRLPALEELKVGQFLLEKGDYDPSPSALPFFRLRSLTATKGRITPLAFKFLTSSSHSTLHTLALPICDLPSKHASFDLSSFSSSSLSSLTLHVFLSSPAVPPSHPSFAEKTAQLARNFSLTLRSLFSYLPHLSLSGTWDAPPPPSPFLPPVSQLGTGLVGGLQANQPVDLVLHAGLLSLLPQPGVGLGALSVRTELNAIALCEWLGDEDNWREGGKGGKGGKEVFRLELWQRASYAREKKRFQERVRERVEEAAARARGGGVKVEWRRYERW